jgi:probable HAF family extracellular repeat protein
VRIIRRGVRTFAVLVVSAASLLAGEARGAPIFLPLGDLPGGGFLSAATGASADGSVVVGVSQSASGDEAFRWTSEDGMVGLGDLPGGAFNSMAWGVSADGSVIVGSAAGVGASGVEAFRWTSRDGMVSLLEGQPSTANGVSGDGSVVVGVIDDEAFRWTSEDGILGLGHISGTCCDSEARAVSADGSIVVGYSESEAFRWTADEGMVGLGDLPGGTHTSAAWAVSADGSVIVGDSFSASSTSQPEAFRWTSSEGMVGLGFLPGGTGLRTARAVSADGSMIGGIGNSHLEAFIWDETFGMRNLRDVLVGLDLDLSGWTLIEVTGIVDDGLGNDNSVTIVGSGLNPSSDLEAFIAQIPEPTTAWLIGLGLGGLATLRRRGRARSLRSLSVRQG